jgi:hypothetical protein
MSLDEVAYVKHMLDEARYLKGAAATLERAAFLTDPTLQWAFVRSLEILGEAAKHVSEPSPGVPWPGYERVDRLRSLSWPGRDNAVRHQPSERSIREPQFNKPISSPRCCHDNDRLRPARRRLCGAAQRPARDGIRAADGGCCEVVEAGTSLSGARRRDRGPDAVGLHARVVATRRFTVPGGPGRGRNEQWLSESSSMHRR